MPSVLTTARLRLVPISLSCTTVSPDQREPIANATGARVPESWPPEHYDQEMLDWTRGLYEKSPGGEYVPRYLILREPEPVVIGMFGAMPPDADGRVIIGYSVLPDYQRRGYASEALAAFIEWVKRDPEVRIVAGDTYPNLIPSIKTMETCGLSLAGAGEGEGVIRYEFRF